MTSAASCVADQKQHQVRDATRPYSALGGRAVHDHPQEGGDGPVVACHGQGGRQWSHLVDAH